MRVGLDERVLYGFVRVGRIAQVVERNSSRAALVPLDQGRVGLSGLVELTRSLEGFDANRDGGVGFSAGF